jgi:hypothetical protein
VARSRTARCSLAAFPPGLARAPPARRPRLPGTAASAAHKAYCQQVALAGNTAVRLAWGRTQEASALYSVMQLFPASLLEEVGCWRSWRGSRGGDPATQACRCRPPDVAKAGLSKGRASFWSAASGRAKQ